MTRLTDAQRERIVAMYLGGTAPKDIAASLRISGSTVNNVIHERRRKLGVDAVPYLGGKSGRPKKNSQPVVTKLLEFDEPPTWAGAFKVLAHRLRDLGDEDGWKMAQEIAKAKGMSL